MPAEIVAIDLRSRLVMRDDGVQGSITNMFDCEGEDTDDPDSARAFVAEMPDGGWVSALVSDFGPRLLH